MYMLVHCKLMSVCSFVHSSTGGVFICAANEAFENVASYGLLPNMVVYLTQEYRLENVVAANVLFLWSAATNFLPIVGAVLADSYFGRYPMIGFGSIVSLLVRFIMSCQLRL